MVHSPAVSSARRALTQGFADVAHSPYGSRRLDRELPGLAAALPRARRQLQPAYESYVHAVSAGDHAMSLELAAFLLELARQTGARRVVDLGSGFSSYVLRRYADERSDTDVTSIDSSPDWLERSRDFVDDHGLDVDRFVDWSCFEPRDEMGSFDVVLHDLGDMTLRTAALSDALLLAGPGGYVVLDDVHKRGYRALVRRVVAASSAWRIDIRAVTRDRLGRYAMLIRRY